MYNLNEPDKIEVLFSQNTNDKIANYRLKLQQLNSIIHLAYKAIVEMNCFNKVKMCDLNRMSGEI